MNTIQPGAQLPNQHAIEGGGQPSSLRRTSGGTGVKGSPLTAKQEPISLKAKGRVAAEKLKFLEGKKASEPPPPLISRRLSAVDPLPAKTLRQQPAADPSAFPPVMQQLHPQFLAELESKLPVQHSGAVDHADLSNISTKDLLKQFAAARGQAGRPQSDARMERLGTALAQRIASADVETFMMVADESAHLPRDAQAAVAAMVKAAMPQLQDKLMLQLVRPIADAVKNKSPSAASDAVETAKLAHAALVRLNPPQPPQKPPTLESLMAIALKTPHLFADAAKIRLIMAGKTATVRKGVAVFSKSPNPVSASVGRIMGGHETANLQIFDRAVILCLTPPPKDTTQSGRPT